MLDDWFTSQGVYLDSRLEVVTDQGAHSVRANQPIPQGSVGEFNLFLLELRGLTRNTLSGDDTQISRAIAAHRILLSARRPPPSRPSSLPPPLRLPAPRSPHWRKIKMGALPRQPSKKYCRCGCLVGPGQLGVSLGTRNGTRDRASRAWNQQGEGEALGNSDRC